MLILQTSFDIIVIIDIQKIFFLPHPFLKKQNVSLLNIFLLKFVQIAEDAASKQQIKFGIVMNLQTSSKQAIARVLFAKLDHLLEFMENTQKTSVIDYERSGLSQSEITASKQTYLNRQQKIRNLKNDLTQRIKILADFQICEAEYRQDLPETPPSFTNFIDEFRSKPWEDQKTILQELHNRAQISETIIDYEIVQNATVRNQLQEKIEQLNNLKEQLVKLKQTRTFKWEKELQQLQNLPRKKLQEEQERITGEDKNNIDSPWYEEGKQKNREKGKEEGEVFIIDMNSVPGDHPYEYSDNSWEDITEDGDAGWTFYL